MSTKLKKKGVKKAHEKGATKKKVKKKTKVVRKSSKKIKKSVKSKTNSKHTKRKFKNNSDEELEDLNLEEAIEPEEKTDTSEKPEDKNDFGIDLEKELYSKDKPIIKVTNLGKKYRKKVVLNNVNLEVNPGDIFGVVGMSGSGKTTLFQLMIGFIKATNGDVEYLIKQTKNGRKTEKYRSVFKFFNQNKIKNLYGYNAQMPSFYEHLTTEVNLKFYGTLYHVPTKELKIRVESLLNVIGLETDRDTLASRLSGGMQKRLDIGCSLIHNPKILFLDEPTADLDPVIRKQMWKLLHAIAKRGTTIILSSHLLDEIEHMCTKIAVIHDHRVLGYGTLEELKGIFARNQEIHLQTTSGNYEKLTEKFKKARLKIIKIEEQEGVLILYTPEGQKILPKIIQIINNSKEKIVSLDLKEPTLKEIFELITTK